MGLSGIKEEASEARKKDWVKFSYSFEFYLLLHALANMLIEIQRGKEAER